MEVDERLRYIHDIVSKLEFCAQSFYKLKRDGDVPKDYMTPEMNAIPQMKTGAVKLFQGFRSGQVKKRAAKKEANALEEEIRQTLYAFHHTLVKNRFFNLTSAKFSARLPKRYGGGHNLLREMKKAEGGINRWGNGASLRDKKSAPLNSLASYAQALWDYYNSIKEFKVYLFQQIKSELKKSIDIIRRRSLTKDLLRAEQNIAKWGTKKSIKSVVKLKPFTKLLGMLTTLYKERTRSLEKKEKLVLKAEKTLQRMEKEVSTLDIPSSMLKKMAPQYIKYTMYKRKYIRTLWSVTPKKIEAVMKEIKNEAVIIKNYMAKEVKFIKKSVPKLIKVCRRQGYKKQYAALKMISKINTKKVGKRDFVKARNVYDQVLITVSNSLSTKVHSYRAELRSEKERVTGYSIGEKLKQSLLKELQRPIDGLTKGIQRAKITKTLEETIVLLDQLVEKAEGFMQAWRKKTEEIMEQEAAKSKVKDQIMRWLKSIGIEKEEKVNDLVIRTLYPVWRKYLEIVADTTIQEFAEKVDDSIYHLEETFKAYGGMGSSLSGKGDEDQMKAQDLNMAIMTLKAERKELKSLSKEADGLIGDMGARSKVIALDIMTKGSTKRNVKDLLMDIQVKREELAQKLEMIKGRVDSVLMMSEITEMISDIEVSHWYCLEKGTIKLFLRLENRYDGELKNVKYTLVIPSDKGTVLQPQEGEWTLESLGKKGETVLAATITPAEATGVVPIDSMLEYEYPNDTDKKAKAPPIVVDLDKVNVEPKVADLGKLTCMVNEVGTDNGYFTGFFITSKDLMDAYEVIQDNLKSLHMVISEEAPTESGENAMVFWYSGARKSDSALYMVLVVARKNNITPTVDVGMAGYSKDMEGLKVFLSSVVNYIQCSITHGSTQRKVTPVDEERARIIVGPILTKAMEMAQESPEVEFVSIENGEEEEAAEWDVVEEDEEPEKVENYSEDNVEWGTVYIVKNQEQAKAYQYFNDMMSREGKTLIVSRTHPDKLKKRKGVENANILWLSKTQGKNCLSPTNIGKIASVINEFLEEKEKGLLILDGLEYIINNNNNFQRVFRWFEDINEAVVLNDSIMVVPLVPETYNDKEMSLLEHNRTVIE